MTSENQQAPGPKGNFILGNALEVWRDPANMVLKGMLEFGDVVRYRFGTIEFFQLNNPDDIQEFFIKKHANYKKSRSYQGVKYVVGNGLLTSEGDLWRRQRKLAQPAFNRKSVEGFAEAMSGYTQDMLDRWDDREQDTTFDIHAEMMRLTLRIVGQTLFSTDLEQDAQEVAEGLDVAMEFAASYVDSILRLPPWVPTPRNIKFRRALKKLDRIVLRIIEEHRNSNEHAGDLLSMLMSATDEDGQGGMTDAQLRDEVMTLVLAGHETTAVALSWTWYLLSKNPDVERKLLDEVSRVVGDGELNLQDLGKLEYTERVIQESMRLYPPAWIFEREAIEDDEIGGYKIPAGSMVAVSPFSLHRDPKLWENPEGFDPDRFLPQRSVNRGRYEYLPFGAGSRVCIGKGFAMMEAKIIVAMVAQRYRLELVPGCVPGTNPGVTLRPKNPIDMIARPQSAKPPGLRIAPPVKVLSAKSA